MDDQLIKDQVRTYYGDVLQTNADLKTSACCTAEAPPVWVRPILGEIHPEIHQRYYGCGSPIPAALGGQVVLDLGCGTGRDAYLLSKLVGPEGAVIGVDMTEAQLEVAQRHVTYHTERFGYDTPNVSFRHGQIEDLREAGIADSSVDLVVSNCVINLSPQKERVFAEIARVLRPGGELYFSDVFSGRRIPPALRADPVLRGECLAGAMYVEDFRRSLRSLGILDHRILSKRRLELHDPEIARVAGMVDFYSMTVRTFKCDFEDIRENYGHVALYKGSLPESPHEFVLDDHHRFRTGIPLPVCGNTTRMLTETRFAPHFTVIGNFDTHYGPFECATPEASPNSSDPCC